MNIKAAVRSFVEKIVEEKIEVEKKSCQQQMQNLQQQISLLQEENRMQNGKADVYFSDISNRLVLLEREQPRISEKMSEGFSDVVQRLMNIESCIFTEKGNGLELCSLELNKTNEQLDEMNKKMAELEENVTRLSVKLRARDRVKRENGSEVLQSKCCSEVKTAANITETTYTSIDYFDFENHFRGSREEIKKRLEIYLPYVRDKKNILDIGCGRGEFLELLKEHGISGIGVDLYEEFVEYCEMKELKVVCGDGLEYLSACENVDGIFAGQLVEHLKLHQLLRLCETAYEKLEQNGVLIMETPNPTTLAIYTNAFYIDPSHEKPVHPLFLKYCLEYVGFKEIEIVYPPESRPWAEIPSLQSSEIENIVEFNDAMKKVSDLLYGSQDYAIIAFKRG